MKHAMLALALLLSSAGTALAGGWNLELASESLEATLYYDLALEGDRLYAAGKRGVDIYDIADPRAPVFAVHLPSDGIANGVAVEDGLVVVGDVYGMELWDASDLAQPVKLGSFDTLGSDVYPERMVIRDGLIYTAAYRGLAVFELTGDPGAPLSLVAHDPGAFYCYRLEMAGDLAVLADVFDLLLYDLSNPRVPTLAGTVPGLVFALEVAVEGSLAYVPYIEGLDIYDISDPAAPVFLGNGGETGSGAAEAVAVAGETAYVAHGAYLDIYDVSDPTDPWQTSFMFVRAPPRGLLVHGDVLYLNEDEAGIEIVDISAPRAPVSLGLVPPPFWGSRRSIETAGGRLYLADGLHGVRILEPTGPGQAAELARIDTPGNAERLEVAGDRLYVADRGSLLIYSVADPASPVQLGSYRSTGQPYDVHVAGTRAYLTDFYGLIVLDVADPAAPLRLGAYFPSNEGTPYTALPWGDLVLLGTGYGGLMVLDATDPERMVRIGQAPTDHSRSYVDLAWVGPELLAAANSTGGFDLIRLADPSAPEIVASLDGRGDSSAALAFAAPYLALAEGSEGVSVYDLTLPASPVLAGWAQTPGSGRGVAWSPAGGLFVADDSSLLGFGFAFEPDTDDPQVELRMAAPEDLAGGKHLIVRGTAADAGAGVARVEVSLDGGPWLEAVGREVWSCLAEPGTSGPVAVEARAVDRLGRIGPAAGVVCDYRPAGPRILMAGFMDSRVASGGGPLRVTALVDDPYGVFHLDEQPVELLYGGQPTGLTLPLDEELTDPASPLRVYSAAFDLGPLAPGLRLAPELRLRDRYGNPSVTWPHLEVP